MFHNKKPLVYLLVAVVSMSLVAQQSIGIISAEPSEQAIFQSPDGFDQGFSQSSQTRQEGIYWWGICNNPLVDAVITEPCNTLVTPDGYALTSEGERVLFCVVGGAILYLIDPAAGEMARQLGPSVGCG